MQIPNQKKKNSLSYIGKEDVIIEESLLSPLSLTTIAGYNKLVPGAAEILLKEIVESHKQHREIEMMEAKNRQKGHYFSMVFTILCLFIAGISIFTGYWFGVGVLFGPFLRKIIYRFQNPIAEEQNTLGRSIYQRFLNPNARRE